MPSSNIRREDEKRPTIPCCPPLPADKGCDYLDYRYRTVHQTQVTDAQKRQRPVNVEVTIHARLERCTGPLSLGDLVYSTTLLPGEKVRLFTLDRRSRFSFDSETNLSYRHEQTSEERYYMASMDRFMADVSVDQFSRADSSSSNSFESNANADGPLSTLLFGPSVNVSGRHDAQSTRTFLSELRSHAESSHNRSVAATRSTSSVSVGEVSTRSHAEGETESHFESSSRTFSNNNRCRAVSYLFYQINKQMTVKLSIISIDRRVIDPASSTRIDSRPPVSAGKITVIPSSVLATQKDRLDIERIGQLSVANKTQDAASAKQLRFTAVQSSGSNFAVFDAEPIPADLRAQALANVDNELVAAGLLDKKNRQVSEETRREFSFSFRTSIPTPGIVVKGCLDDCEVCDPAYKRQINLELENMELENALLKRKIELLDKAQEYRCCPHPEEEETVES